MKLRNLFEAIGFRGSPKRFPYAVTDAGCKVRYAQWLHPRERTKDISVDLINSYREYIGEGDFAIDIGAHTGDTTIPMAVAAGPTGCVLALEPNPYVYHVLEKNIRANMAVANIKSIMAAAGASEGFMTMEYSDSGFCNGGRHEGISPLQHGHFYRQDVFSVNLERELRDDFLDWLPRLKFIKVDAEGYDLNILNSLKSVISDYRPVIQTEIYKKSKPFYRESIFTFFRNLEYRVYAVGDRALKPSTELFAPHSSSKLHYDILAIPSLERF